MLNSRPAALGARPSCELTRRHCVRPQRSSRMVRYTPSAPKGRPVVPPEPAPRAQPGDHPPAGPVRCGPGHLAAEHHHLLAQHQDLRVLGRLTAAQQDQPAKDRTMIKYSRRKDMDRDHASTPPPTPTASQSPCIEF